MSETFTAYDRSDGGRPVVVRHIRSATKPNKQQQKQSNKKKSRSQSRSRSRSRERRYPLATPSSRRNFESTSVQSSRQASVVSKNEIVQKRRFNSWQFWLAISVFILINLIWITLVIVAGVTNKTGPFTWTWIVLSACVFVFPALGMVIASNWTYGGYYKTNFGWQLLIIAIGLFGFGITTMSILWHGDWWVMLLLIGIAFDLFLLGIGAFIMWRTWWFAPGVVASQTACCCCSITCGAFTLLGLFVLLPFITFANVGNRYFGLYGIFAGCLIGIFFYGALFCLLGYFGWINRERVWNVASSATNAANTTVINIDEHNNSPNDSHKTYQNQRTTQRVQQEAPSYPSASHDGYDEYY